jgi:DNA-binding NarL/FixJ family response regulator
VLLDLVMPGLGGVETIRRIAQRCLQTRVLVLTSFGSHLDLSPALQAGTVAWLPKDADPHLLVRMIRHAARCRPEPLPLVQA